MEEQAGRKTVVVAGATGRRGGAVARELLKAGYPVRALTRDPDSKRGRALARLGAEVLKCDLADTDTVKQVLQGAWGVFAVFEYPEQGARWEMETGRRFTATAKNSGIKHYVYGSAAAAPLKTGVPQFDSKAVIEDAVRGARFDSHVILRPAFLMEDFTLPRMMAGIEEGRLCMPLQPETRLQMVAVADVGKFGRAAFRRAGDLNGEEIDIAGDERTLSETAEILSASYGRKVEFVPEDLDALRKQSPDRAALFEWLDLMEFGINVQELPAKYGVKPLTLQQWAQKARWPEYAA